MKIWLFLLLIILISGCSTQQTEVVCPDCNVLIVLIDTLRAQDLGCYGSNLNTSPFIDSFAKESALFLNDFSQATTTFPSHMSIFTSTYPGCNRFMVVGKDKLDKSIPTIAEIMTNVGYSAVWAAPLHDWQLSLSSGYERGFDAFFESDWEKGIDWLDNQNKPVFGFFHTYHVHDPYLPQKSTIQELNESMLDASQRIFYNKDSVREELEKEILKDSAANLRAFGHDYSANFSKMDYGDEIDSAVASFLNQVLEDPKKGMDNLHILLSRIERQYYFKLFNLNTDAELLNFLYKCEIREVDEDFRKLVDDLKARGIYNKTIIVLTADHGEEFSEHQSYEHYYIHDETTHVPLIIHIPGIQPKTFNGLVENIDILPTLLDAVGIQKRAEFQGKSLFGYILNGSELPDSEAFTQLYSMFSVRTPKWRLVLTNESRTNKQGFIMPKLELLSVKNGDDSPQELSAEYPEVVESLNKTLTAWKNSNNRCKQYNSTDWWLKLDSATKKRIRETGYW